MIRITLQEERAASTGFLEVWAAPVADQHTWLWLWRAGHELQGVDPLERRGSAVMARRFREAEDLVLIGLEPKPGQAHRRPHHVAHQRLQGLGVANGQTHLVVDGEARVSTGQQQLQPLLSEQFLAPEQA